MGGSMSLNYDRLWTQTDGLLLTVRCNLLYLHSKDAKDYEERTADEDDVADGFEGGDERLYHQLQTWSSADHSEQRTNHTFITLNLHR